MTRPNRFESRAEAKRRQARRKAWKPARDALIAFAVFPLLALTVGSGPLLAGPTAVATVDFGNSAAVIKALDDQAPAPVVQIATVAPHDEADALYRRTSFDAAWVLLGASFALIVALNLAVARHLSRAYTRRR